MFCFGGGSDSENETPGPSRNAQNDALLVYECSLAMDARRPGLEAIRPAQPSAPAPIKASDKLKKLKAAASKLTLPLPPIQTSGASKRRYVVFRGNGTSFLRDAFERRPEWCGPELTSWAVATNVLPVRGALLASSSAAAVEPLTKQQENLLLSKALTEGGVSFVFRDLLCGPHFGAGRQAEGFAPPSASLYSADYPAVDSHGRPQTVNRWPSHASLTTKDGSLASLVAYYREQGLSPWAFVPLSFYVPNLKLLKVEPANCHAWRAVRAAHALVGRGADPRVPAEQRATNLTNLWLLKPTNGSGGEGIAIASDISELERALETARPSTQGFIAQKYIEAPLLYQGRKFDLRVWVVVESDPGSLAGLRVWAYREGYARTSSEAYSLPKPPTPATAPAAAPAAATAMGREATEAAAAHVRLVHLTNYCMQAQSDKCGRFEEGNAISFDEIGRHVHPHIDFRADVLPRIYAIVADAVLAARKELVGGLREQGRGRRVCHLFGYDFMLTASGVPYLIEVNANPLLAAQNEWHGKLVARMVDDYVELAADGPAAVAAGPCTPPQPRPPLDGVHCADFAGSGFQLLIGRAVVPAVGPAVGPAAAEAPAEATAATEAEVLMGVTDDDHDDLSSPAPAGAAGPSQPLFGLRTINGVLALSRSESEREAAAVVPEPELPSDVLHPAAINPEPPLPPPSIAPKLAAMNTIRNEAVATAAAAHVRRLAAMRFAEAHRNKVRRSVV